MGSIKLSSVTTKSGLIILHSHLQNLILKDRELIDIVSHKAVENLDISPGRGSCCEGPGWFKWIFLNQPPYKNLQNGLTFRWCAILSKNLNHPSSNKSVFTHRCFILVKLIFNMWYILGMVYCKQTIKWKNKQLPIGKK